MHLPPKKYFGKIKFERSLSDYHLSLSHHNTEEHIPRHSHKNPYISLNIGAGYLERGTTRKRIIEPGKIILRPAYYQHENTFPQKRGLCFNIEVTTTTNGDVLRLFQEQDARFDPLRFVQILAKASRDYTNDELECLITETLLEQQNASTQTQTPSWYGRVTGMIREECHRSLSLAQIAESASIHPNYLARKFKQVCGMTMGDYMRKVRLEKAILMLPSDKRLTDIAFESGFYDQPHFSNTCRSLLHIYPRALRALISG